MRISTMNNRPSADPNLLFKLKIVLFDEHSPEEDGRWRRVIVPSNFSLYALHILIQEVFGWQSYHMHCFTTIAEDDDSLSESEEERSKVKPTTKVTATCQKRYPVEYKVVDANWDMEYLTEAGQRNGLYARHSHVHERGVYFMSPHQIRDERVYRLCDVFNESNRFLEYEYDFGASWTHVIEFEGVSTMDAAQNGEYPMCVEGKGANRKEDHQDENEDGDLLPSFKRKKFNRQQTQKNLRRIFEGKWPLKFDNLALPKCYMCQWYNMKRGACRKGPCDGKCCAICLKSELNRRSIPLPDEEAHRAFAATEECINKLRTDFLKSNVCNYKEKNGSPCEMCKRK